MTEQMKQSDIAWIGNIPESWNIKRIKYLASLKGRIKAEVKALNSSVEISSCSLKYCFKNLYTSS